MKPLLGACRLRKRASPGPSLRKVDDHPRHGNDIARMGLRPIAVELERKPPFEHEEAIAVLPVEMRIGPAFALGVTGLGNG
jgi:hypothetical protein